MPDSSKILNTTKKTRKDIEPWNPDQDLFTELLITHKSRKYYNICLEASPDSPLYNVVCRTNLKQAFDIVLHKGANNVGPTVGVVRLHIRQQEIGVGDPNYIIEDGGDQRERMVWERLRKPTMFSTKEFFFDYGEGRERKTYVWRRVRDLFPRPFTDIGLWEVGKEKGHGDGLPLAIWKKNSTWGTVLKNGSFFLRSVPDTGGDDVKEKRWEVMVLLTALALLELAGGKS